MSIYKHPEAYELAFAYRDVDSQVDFLETRLEKYALCEERTILGVACGPAAHLREWARRGYQVVGFDVYPEMVSYARRRFEEERLEGRFFLADMREFHCERPVGFAQNLLTSFNYLLDDAQVRRHLQAMARAVIPGGVYFIELNHPRERERWGTSATNSWIVEREGLEVEVDWDYQRRPPHPVTGISRGVARMVLRQGGQEQEILMPEQVRIYSLPELRALVEEEGSFELVRAQGDFRLGHEFDDSPRSWRLLVTLQRRDAAS
jgi:SAM-dependent methyltransferase